MNGAKQEGPDCRRCRHLWITHEPGHPYGCRAFGMKSAQLPSLEVLRSSGKPCLAFEERAPPPTSAESRTP